jgi:hypothetical protein
MSMTNITIYKNEIRDVTISIRDQEDDEFAPTHVTSYVVDSENNTIVNDEERQVTTNSISMTIPQTVTSTVGTYYIIWSIYKNESLYRHKTCVTVNDL